MLVKWFLFDYEKSIELDKGFLVKKSRSGAFSAVTRLVQKMKLNDKTLYDVVCCCDDGEYHRFFEGIEPLGSWSK